MSDSDKTSGYSAAGEFFSDKFGVPQVFFGVAAFLLASFLLLKLPEETKYFEGLVWYKQPSLTPAVSIIGMLLFGFFQAIQYFRKGVAWDNAIFKQEISAWVRALEFVVWFMLYVMLVPYLGYLLATMFFMGALVYRQGYRSFKAQAASFIISFLIVFTFKSFLQVKIPGGLIYEYLPAALRNFMLINF